MPSIESTGEVRPTRARGYKGLAMEGVIARWYDKNARKSTPEQYVTWANTVAENVAEGDSVLEVAPGPGYLGIALAKRGHYNIIRLDISRTFVQIAKKNATEAGVKTAVEFRQGDAAHMPFDDDSFDFIICSAAFKNFADPVGVLLEMNRVLRENKSAMIIDMRRDASNEALRGAIKSMGLSRRASLSMYWTFWFLRRTAYTKDQFEEFIAQAHFRKHVIRNSADAIGFEIWLEK